MPHAPRDGTLLDLSRRPEPADWRYSRGWPTSISTRTGPAVTIADRAPETAASRLP
jgi:hypothetical protein